MGFVLTPFLRDMCGPGPCWVPLLLVTAHVHHRAGGNRAAHSTTLAIIGQLYDKQRGTSITQNLLLQAADERNPLISLGFNPGLSQIC